ncbi:MAG: MalY/PatB family protein [Saprospiraceae bacterium]
MNYNFDKIINRKNTNALSIEGYKDYLFGDIENLNIPYKEEELIKMWVADMAFEIAPEIRNALKKRIDNGILGYTMMFDKQYPNAFLNWTKTKYDWEFNPKHLVYSKGVIPALFALIDYICKPNKKVLIMTPSYAFFKHAADYNNVELVYSDLINQDGHYTMNFEDIERKTANEDVALCIFCHPHNPTGRVWKTEELQRFGEICLANNVMIISDEIHCDVLRSEQNFTPLAKLFPDSDQIITCMAPSKTFNLAGILFANVIIPNDELRAEWKKHHIGIENPLSVTAAQAAYEQGQNWLNELTIYLDNNFDYLRKYLTTHLPKAKFTIPEAMYLAWVDVGAYFPKDENLTLFFAEKAGVLLEGGDMFVSNADGFIRLNLACPKSVLEEGLRRIVEAIS